MPQTYRVTFKDSVGDYNRTVTATNPDDACGEATDRIAEEQHMTLDEFNTNFKLVAITREVGGAPGAGLTPVAA